MNYPLHTTGDAAQLRLMFGEPSRRAIWVHVGSDAERREVEVRIERAGWRVVGTDKLPRFFVAAVRMDVTPWESTRFVGLIQPRQCQKDIIFLGELFGYPERDIAWYMDAVHAGPP